MELFNENDLNITKYAWIFWIYLPIPISSIILGYKYRKQGIKCTKNIVGGFIIAFLLIVYGAFVFTPNYETDYKNIYIYKDIIGVTLPLNGTYSKYVWGQSNLKKHITNYVQFSDYDAANEFIEELKESEHWIKDDELKSILTIFIPSYSICSSNDVCYYSIFIEEINDYNVLPLESGKYKIYAMVYSKDSQMLKIDEYVYDYVS